MSNFFYMLHILNNFLKQFYYIIIDKKIKAQIKHLYFLFKVNFTLKFINEIICILKFINKITYFQYNFYK